MMRAVLCALLAVPLAAQTVIKSSGASAGGGASNLDGLSDVTITSAADGDGLRHNGTAFVNTALFTAGTSDILAARMQTNVRTAIGAGLTASRIPRTVGGVLVDDDASAAEIWVAGQKRFWVDASGHSNVSVGRFLYLASNTVSLQGVSNNMVLRTGANQYIDFQENNQYIVRFGGPDQTALIQDQTATTGDTLLKVLSGAGESGNCQEWDDDGTGALASVDCETGNSLFSNVTLGTTGATFYGPSASEPIDCTTANDGSMYFDTDDQKLCICANDGTDDEWLHSDNYGHGSGHCSI